MENGPGGKVDAGRDQLGRRVGQRDPDSDEEAAKRKGEQMDTDLLQAELAGLGGEVGGERGVGGEGDKDDFLRSSSGNSGDGGPFIERGMAGGG